MMSTFNVRCLMSTCQFNPLYVKVSITWWLGRNPVYLSLGTQILLSAFEVMIFVLSRYSADVKVD